jgi:hypothetical protein
VAGGEVAVAAVTREHMMRVNLDNGDAILEPRELP